MNGVEATALPALSLHVHMQRNGEMGIIGGDGQEFRPQEEGGVSPRGSGNGRTPTMVRCPCAGDWRTVTQTSYATTSRGEPLRKFGFLGMIGGDDGQGTPRRDAINLTPLRVHTSPPRGRPLEK